MAMTQQAMELLDDVVTSPEYIEKTPCNEISSGPLLCLFESDSLLFSNLCNSATFKICALHWAWFFAQSAVSSLHSKGLLLPQHYAVVILKHMQKSLFRIFQDFFFVIKSLTKDCNKKLTDAPRCHKILKT